MEENINKIYIDKYSKCPICGSYLKYEEIDYNNPGAMTWCSNEKCDYRYNQFLTYEDFKELEIF